MDQSLYELIGKFTDSNLDYVVDWVVSRQLSERNGVQESTPTTQFSFYLDQIIRESADKRRREFDQSKKWFSSLKLKPIFETSEVVDNVLELEGKIDDYWASVLCSQLPSDVARNMGLALKRKDYSHASQIIQKFSLLKPTPSDEINRSVELLRKEYLTDTNQLISKLLEILYDEYTKQTGEIKVSLARYLASHRDALSRVEGDLEKINGAMDNLEREKNLSSVEKDSFRASLMASKLRLDKLRVDETENARRVHIFTDEIRKAKARFEELLGLLEEKSQQARVRKKYIAVLSELNAEVPLLEDHFKQLGEYLNRNIADYRKSLFLMDSRINENLISGLDNQMIVNEVFGEPELQIVDSLRKKLEEHRPLEDGGFEIDLDFLNTKRLETEI